ncbi:uracil-DNA glycosylase-like isoform X2 [Pecten maximus]|uniref:uracil-DNA glycosylase-like isoform X2 n=1 Tax=Pecten maximus TaxID=6579 RepID=UPI001458AE51|nr:uracil-DNA glycosylase-like isoform X2 [Pecten maximus]
MAYGPGSCSPSTFLTKGRWRDELNGEFNKTILYKDMEARLNDEYAKRTVYPPKHLVFNAFNLTPLEKVKVVIIGQDPYPTFGKVKKSFLAAKNPCPTFPMAMGLSFSVPKMFEIPPSLSNIFRNLEKEIPNYIIPSHGNLEEWADRGVLLLNATLTVAPNDANSHSKYGWKIFTDRVIQIINDKCDKVVFLLLGEDAHKMETKIDPKHRAVRAPHPVYYTFKDCQCFAEVNRVLCDLGIDEMDWSLTDELSF